MTIDFAFGKAPARRLAYTRWTGPWSEKRIRSEFEKLERAIRAAGGTTGAWIFREPGERKWEVAIELRGRPREGHGLRLRSVRPTSIAHVQFDPDVLSPRVVYHGLSDWLRWRKREKEIRSAGTSQEVYSGNPWRDRRAWAKTDIQVAVRR